MPSAVLVRTVIFDEGLYRGNGDVGRWVKLITRHFGEHAVRYAPERSGELKAGIMWSSRQIGVRQVAGTIESTSPHTMFVLRGTGVPGKGRAGWIYARSKPYMVIPAGNGWPEIRRAQVHGQEPNNFLLRAWRATARNHRSIRGWVPTFIGRP